MDQVELPPGSCVGLWSDTDVVVLGLMATPAAPLVSVNTQCSGARHGAASTGCFRSAAKKYCVEKMAAGKCRAESAAKINLSFVGEAAPGGDPAALVLQAGMLLGDCVAAR